jgi:NADPH-dependent ferric siderophore reductase
VPSSYLTRLSVLRAHDVTPAMRRLVLGGPELSQLVERWSGDTDAYVKIAFLAPGVDYPEQIDLAEIRESHPAEHWPVLRTYTIRRLDPEAGELWIDFVVHGDEGLAGPWATRAQVGEVVHLRGPGGAYRPDPEADHQLLVGDEAAIPAILAAIESLRPGQRATAFVEVDGPEHEQPVVTDGDVEVHWLHRAPAHAGTTTLLDEAVRAWPWPGGRVQIFVHGESGLLKSVRPYLVKERGVERRDVSVSAYWRLGETEEGFREWKAAERARGEEPMMTPEAPRA